VLADEYVASRPMLVQTPHGRSDARTGHLGLKAFLESDAAAFFSSTMRRDAPVKREIPVDGDEPELSLADPSHNTLHFFQGATRAFALTHPDLLVVQLHGFKEIPDDETRHFEIVISAGLQPEKENARHRKIKGTALKSLKKRKTGLFGVQTQILGALTNVQGQLINRSGTGMFIHIELSRSYRNALFSDSKLMNQFIQMIRKVKRNYEKL